MFLSPRLIVWQGQSPWPSSLVDGAVLFDFFSCVRVPAVFYDYVRREIDVSPALRWRAKAKKKKAPGGGLCCGLLLLHSLKSLETVLQAEREKLVKYHPPSFLSSSSSWPEIPSDQFCVGKRVKPVIGYKSSSSLYHLGLPPKRKERRQPSFFFSLYS